jgi:hypothetical protein
MTTKERQNMESTFGYKDALYEEVPVEAVPDGSVVVLDENKPGPDRLAEDELFAFKTRDGRVAITSTASGGFRIAELAYVKGNAGQWAIHKYSEDLGQAVARLKEPWVTANYLIPAIAMLLAAFQIAASRGEKALDDLQMSAMWFSTDGVGWAFVPKEDPGALLMTAGRVLGREGIFLGDFYDAMLPALRAGSAVVADALEGWPAK